MSPPPKSSPHTYKIICCSECGKQEALTFCKGMFAYALPPGWVRFGVGETEELYTCDKCKGL